MTERESQYLFEKYRSPFVNRRGSALAPSDEGGCHRKVTGGENDFTVFSPSAPLGHLPHQREAFVRCVTVRPIQVYLTGIVGAAICRPRATNSRPYDILIKLPAKFKFVSLVRCKTVRQIQFYALALTAPKAPLCKGRLGSVRNSSTNWNLSA